MGLLILYILALCLIIILDMIVKDNETERKQNIIQFLFWKIELNDDEMEIYKKMLKRQ